MRTPIAKRYEVYLAAEEFPLEEGATFFDPVLFFHEGNVLFGVVDVVMFKPDIEKKFADEAVDAGFVGVPARDVDPFFQFKKDREHPLHIVIIKVTTHDEHVKHMGPGTIHDCFKGRKVFRTLFFDDLFCYVQALPMVGMVIMGAVRFDVVFPLVRHDDGMLSQELLPFFFSQDLVFLGFDVVDFFARKIAAVMDKPQIIGIKVLPGPVQARQFTEMRISGADVVPCIVRYITDRILPFGTDMNGNIHRIRRHPVFFMGGDDDFDRHSFDLFQRCGDAAHRVFNL